MYQVSVSICGKVWWWFEHLYSQPQWQLGTPREEATVCSTIVRYSPADCTCSLCHQWLGIEAFWKVAAVRSRAWENCVEGERKLSYLKVREKSWRCMSVSEHWLSCIWGWTLAKHMKGNWVRSFGVFFSPHPPESMTYFYLFSRFPCMQISFLSPSEKGKMHLIKQLQVYSQSANKSYSFTIWFQDIIFILPDLDFI